VNAAVPGREAPAGLDTNLEQSLYEVRRKIYPRAVHGAFARWRWGLVFATQLVFYGTPWLAWNDRQAVLFDLGARKFYIFGLVLWPQDFIYLTVLLVLAALSLFLFTAIAGRLWCGYACPQTVYTEIFLQIERWIEGDHRAREKLDRSATGARKVGLKAAKHFVWGALSLWTGFTFVGYFTPIHMLLAEAARLSFGAWEWFWILFYGFATYGNAGWMREQVCKYMCPYARFQSSMFDTDTLVITYDPQRGEPRGSRARKADPKSLGLGDCVDCGICVQVCPTGIDIRKGLQYECIGCAACIDGCDQVMDKMGYPRGLIRYASENALQQHATGSAMLRRIFRPRTMVYTAILLAVATAGGVSLYLRNPLKMDVIRDRGALAREASPGVIENVYKIQIMNTDEKARTFRLSAEGLPGLAVAGMPQTLEVGAAATRLLPMRLQVPADAAKPGTHRIELVLEAVDDSSISRREKSTFIMPNP